MTDDEYKNTMQELQIKSSKKQYEVLEQQDKALKAQEAAFNKIITFIEKYEDKLLNSE